METQINKPKTNLWKIWGIIAIIILVLTGSYFFLNYEKNISYSEGYSAGLLYTANTGNIPYIDNSTGNPQIKEISLQEKGFTIKIKESS